MSLENFFTFDNLRGLPIDPEAISGYSMFSTNYNLGRTNAVHRYSKVYHVVFN